jgi:hypothetical protein
MMEDILKCDHGLLESRCERCANPNCSQCQDVTNPTRHKGSPYCRCGSIASGGPNAHCTCDICY